MINFSEIDEMIRIKKPKPEEPKLHPDRNTAKLDEVHYVGIATHKTTGKYYFFKRKLKDAKTPEKEWYWGSGGGMNKLSDSYKKKNFDRKILKKFDNDKDAKLFEQEMIVSVDWERDHLCLNKRGGDFGRISRESMGDTSRFLRDCERMVSDYYDGK